MAEDTPHTPSPPSDVKINGKPESDDMATLWHGGDLIVSATLEDNKGHNVRLIVVGEVVDDKALSRPAVNNKIFRSDWVKAGKRAQVNLQGMGLNSNTHYRLWLTTKDSAGKESVQSSSGPGSSAVKFWTNRPPVVTPVQPANNTQFKTINPVALDWSYDDPDDPSGKHLQGGFRVRWREATQPDGTRARDWESPDDMPANGFPTVEPRTAATTTYTIAANTLKGNRVYEWQVQARDEQGAWSGWSLTRDFYTRALQSSPRLVSPTNGEAVDASQPIVFEWDFKDPEHGDYQTKADIRYRPVGEATSAWVLRAGIVTTAESWTAPPNTLIPGVQYEWETQTYDNGSGGATPSGWSAPERFHTVKTPGWALDPTVSIIEDAPIQGSLGCGHHRVFVYLQGGQVPIGEITPIQSLQWQRARDDISAALLITNGFGADCGQMLATVHTWMHELVIFRDGIRVWEGPITRIADHSDHVEIEAKDVMAYVYRRIMRQGYNDTTYKIGQKKESKPGVPIGTQTVVNRAAQILTNALAYHDPNVLPYLTVIRNAGDAEESRIVPDYSRTAWEEIDDLAANNGIDYVAVGRRVMIFDTHRAIGTLPEMRGEDFSAPPVLTEYGMQFTNYYAVTDNSGTWGYAYPPEASLKAAGVENWFDIYGPIEMLASSYSGADGSGQSPATNKAKQELVEKFSEQARRGIAHRWPAPMEIRVPDNSTLNPEVNVGIQQLIPGVWIPVRFEGAILSVAQWQKLDAVNVTETDQGEKVAVILSPAPNGGRDPDADTAASEAAT